MPQERLRRSLFDQANFFSKLTFWWLNPLFCKSASQVAEVSGQYDVPVANEADLLERRLDSEWKKEVRKYSEGGNASLVTAISSAFRLQWLLSGIVLLLGETARVAQPVLLGFLLAYLADRRQITSTDAYLYGFGLASMLCVHALCCSLYTFLTHRAALRMKTALEALAYRKVMSLSSEAALQTSPTSVIQQLAGNTHIFSQAVEHLHYLWVGPLQIAVVVFLVWQEMGATGLVCLAVVVIVMGLQAGLVLAASKCREKAKMWTEQRGQMTSHILAAMLQVKVRCLENTVTPLITALRSKEIPWLRGSATLQGISLCVLGASCRLMLLLIVRVMLDEDHTLQAVFTTFALLDVLMWCVYHFPVHSVWHLLAWRSALQGVQNFLLLDEEKEQIKDLRLHRTVSYRSEPRADWVVDIDHMTARWRTIHTGGRKRFQKRRVRSSTSSTKSLLHESDAEHAFSLKYLSLQVKKGEMLAVIGMPHSGKTSLLMTLTGELPYEIGQIAVNGRVSFCGQTPWLFSASIRDNILFGDAYDATRYDAVVRACCLGSLFGRLPSGDRTVVGDSGLQLSNGYAARVTLARAVYNKADLYLLDDILTWVDNATRQELSRGCLDGMLQDKTRIVVTQNMPCLRTAHRIAVFREGSLYDIGSLEELQSRGVDVREFVHADQTYRRAQVEAEEEQFHVRLQLMSIAEENDKKDMNTSHSDVATFFRFLSSSLTWALLPLVALLWLGSQALASAADWMLAVWVDTKSTTPTSGPSGIVSYQPTPSSFPPMVQHQAEADLASTTSQPGPLLLYLSLTGSAVAVALLCVITVMQLCVGATQALHQKMLSVLMKAQASFFLITPLHDILSVFTQHLKFIDTRLPLLAYLTTEMSLRTVAVVVLVCVVCPWLVFAAVVVVVVMAILQVVAGRTLQGIRHFRETARGPVYTDIRETLSGLQTIRAFRRNDHFLQEFDSHLNSLTWARFLDLCTVTRLSVICAFVLVIYTSIVIYVSLAVTGDVRGGLLGLALTYCITLVLPLHLLLQQSLALSNQMASVERAVTLAQQQQEAAWFSDKPPPSNWPHRGSITFSQASLLAGPEGPYILRSIDVHIPSKEKVGVVGETGSGKYSLSAMLMRLQPVQGMIFIDGFNVVNIGLHELRKNITVVPQEPVLLPGTLRDNLDPGGVYTDEQLWTVLDKVGLRDKVTNIQGALSAEVTSDAMTFSLGQCQLVCLARALLMKTRIVLFEEVMDSSEQGLTDHIQRVVRAKFRECTVIMVAHRLASVMDCDRIMVFVEGEVREFDTPYNLLQQPNGYFTRLVEQCGRRQAQQLHSMAEVSHQHRASASLMLEHAVFMATEQLHASTEDLTFKPGSLAWSHLAKFAKSQDSLEKAHSDWGSRGDVGEEADMPAPRPKTQPALAPAQKLIHKRRASPKHSKRTSDERPEEVTGRRDGDKEGGEGPEEVPLLSYDAPPKAAAHPRSSDEIRQGAGDTAGSHQDDSRDRGHRHNDSRDRGQRNGHHDRRPLLSYNFSPRTRGQTSPRSSGQPRSPSSPRSPSQTSPRSSGQPRSPSSPRSPSQTSPRSSTRNFEHNSRGAPRSHVLETTIDALPSTHRNFSPFPADTDAGRTSSPGRDKQPSVAPGGMVYKREPRARIISGQYSPQAESEKEDTEKIIFC